MNIKSRTGWTSASTTLVIMHDSMRLCPFLLLFIIRRYGVPEFFLPFFSWIDAGKKRFKSQGGYLDLFGLMFYVIDDTIIFCMKRKGANRFGIPPLHLRVYVYDHEWNLSLQFSGYLSYTLPTCEALTNDNSLDYHLKHRDGLFQCPQGGVDISLPALGWLYGFGHILVLYLVQSAVIELISSWSLLAAVKFALNFSASFLASCMRSLAAR